MSTIQAADLETGLHSRENRILSLVISTRLCLNQQLAVVVVKPKFYFKQIPHMLCVTAVSSWRKALCSSGWDYKQAMGFKVLLIPALDAHELPLIRQGENFMEKQFWRSREGCETIDLIHWGNIPRAVHITGCSAGLTWPQTSQSGQLCQDSGGWCRYFAVSLTDAVCESAENLHHCFKARICVVLMVAAEFCFASLGILKGWL